MDWIEAKRRQKDVDARWTKKREQDHFGSKNHIAVDVKHKFIRAWRVTAANVHDSQVFLERLARNTSRVVYADSAYLSEESQKRLKALGYRPHIQRKGQKNHPLSELHPGIWTSKMMFSLRGHEQWKDREDACTERSCVSARRS